MEQAGEAGPENRPAQPGQNAERSAFCRWSAGRRSVSVAGFARPQITARARLGMGLASPSGWASQTHSGKARSAAGVTHRLPPKGAVAQRPGASRRSIPLREKEKGPAVPTPSQTTGRRSVGCSSSRSGRKVGYHHRNRKTDRRVWAAHISACTLVRRARRVARRGGRASPEGCPKGTRSGSDGVRA